MTVQVLPSALADLMNGFDFYEEQDQGAGDYFHKCLIAEIDSLSQNAPIHPQTGGCHRLLTRRFPYAIYYLIENETVTVFRVLDCRRDPEWLRQQLP